MKTGKETGKVRPDDETSFLNVDLDIEAAHDLSPLVQAMGDAVFDLHTGPTGATYQSHLELAGQPVSAEAAIVRFVELLEDFRPRRRPCGRARLDETSTLASGRVLHRVPSSSRCSPTH